MSGLDLDAIEARVAGAHRGLWEAAKTTDGKWGVADSRALNPFAEDKWGAIIVGVEMTDADAEFIAHARTDIPALVARVRELEAVVERVKALATDLAETDGEPLTGDGLTALVAANRYGRMFLSAIEGDRA